MNAPATPCLSKLAFRVLALSMACGALLQACEQPSRSESPRASASHAAEPTHYLDEWFAVGDARCRLNTVQPAMTERLAQTNAKPSDQKRARVPEDIAVLDTSWSCEDAAGAQVSARVALFERARITFVDDQLTSHAAAGDTKLEQRAPEHLAFELAPARQALSGPRRYSASTCEPLGARKQKPTRIDIALAPDTQVRIATRNRLHDLTFDQLVDRLVQTLCAAAPLEALSVTPEGHLGIELAGTLLQRATAQQDGLELVLAEAAVREGQPRVTLAIERARSADSAALELVFELDLASRPPTVLRLLDVEGTKAALSCADARRELDNAAERTAERVRSQPSDRGPCNALGTLLSEPCERADRALLREALRVGTACADQHESELFRHLPSSTPADFSLTLLRGPMPLIVESSLAHPRARFDRSQNYTVSFEQTGKVQFQSRRDDLPRSFEGRTSDAFVSLLFGQLVDLDWFGRTASHTGKRCNSDDERGDTFRVRANGRERAVLDRDGCRGGFTEAELAALRTSIEQAAAVRAWTSSSFAEGISEAQIWVVAADE